MYMKLEVSETQAADASVMLVKTVLYVTHLTKTRLISNFVTF